MFEVLKRDLNLASDLLGNHSDMMFASVVSGNNPGKVWVDNLESPASALVWSEGLRCFQFMGCAHKLSKDKLKAFIDYTIIDFLKEKKLDFFEYASDEDEWYPVISNVLSNREIKENWQYVYKSNSNIQNAFEAILPEPYCLYSIDAGFIASVTKDKPLSNSGFLVDYIIEYWGTVQNFLDQGYGFAAVCQDKIASFSLTSFLYEETFAIGVETLEQYRRNGLAGTLTKILLKTLYTKDYKVWWDCMDSNIASQKTAESAGLVRDHKYKVCWFNF